MGRDSVASVRGRILVNSGCQRTESGGRRLKPSCRPLVSLPRSCTSHVQPRSPDVHQESPIIPLAMMGTIDIRSRTSPHTSTSSQHSL